LALSPHGEGINTYEGVRCGKDRCGGAMEPVRFADILFILITLVITFAILWLVNKSKRKPETTTGSNQTESSDAVFSAKEGE
jgi:hypothetical protein